MLWCNRGWGETGDHSHVSHFLIASWQLNNIIYFVVYCLIVRNIPQYIAIKKKHLNVLHLHCTYLSSFRWPFRWCYCSAWVNRVSSLHLWFQSSPATENIQRLQIVSSDFLCRVAIIIPEGGLGWQVLLHSGVVLVPAPVGYDSLGYLQQLSEQCLRDLMQSSGHNYSNVF